MKKSFVKMLSLVTAITLTVGMFAGCGKQKANDKDEQGRTIVTVGGWPSKDGVDLDNYEARRQKFEEENKDAVIVPDEWRFELQTFYAKAAGGQLPILFDTYFTEISQIIDAGYAADISKVLKKRGYDDKFNPKIMELISRNGKIYGFPFASYILGLVYNTELFEAAGLVEEDGTPKQPKDWDEVVEFAVQIKEKTGKPGFIFPSGDNSAGWLFTCLAWSFGTDFMEQDEDGKWKATFNTPEAAAALQYIKDLKWKYDVLPANALIDGNEFNKLFATGNGAMRMAAGDIPRNLIQYGMKPDQFGMMAMPVGPKRHVTLMGGNLFCLNKDATEEQIDAAIRWIEMTNTYKITDDFKKASEEGIVKALSENQLVGIKSMTTWNTNTESVKYNHDLIDKNANANPNHVKLYNDFVNNCPADIQPEEPVCAQELYGVLTSCIQEVLVNKDADCAKLLEKANSDFQINYLDNLTY